MSVILDDMWECNRQHVGDRTREAEAYLVLTGEGDKITQRLIGWCRNYFERRLAMHNSKDRSDPLEKFLRLVGEYNDIIVTRLNQPSSIAYVLIEECTAYVEWFLGKNTWVERFGMRRTLDGLEPVLDWRPARKDTAGICLKTLASWGWLESSLAEFVESVAESASETLNELSCTSADESRQILQGLVQDIQEMRPLLVKNFNPEKSMVAVGDKLIIACQWILRFGLASIFGATSERDMLAAISKGEFQQMVILRPNGLLADSLRPWETADDAEILDAATGLAVSRFVLEKFHGRLFSFYEQIDLARVLHAVDTASIDELDEETVAAACRVLAEQPDGEDEDPEACDDIPRRRIKPLRLRKLLSILEHELGCEVKQGKGSEFTVYRKGGRKFRLGRHRRDYEVHAILVQRLLRRLGIQKGEWVAAVMG